MEFFDRLVKDCIETRAREKGRVREFFRHAPSPRVLRRHALLLQPRKLPLAVPRPSTIQQKEKPVPAPAPAPIPHAKPTVSGEFKKSIMEKETPAAPSRPIRQYFRPSFVPKYRMIKKPEEVPRPSD